MHLKNDSRKIMPRYTQTAVVVVVVVVIVVIVINCRVI